MFTGLIQGQGSITAIQAQGNDKRLTVRTHFTLENVELGESIAVNGVCLTVESGDSNSFTAFVSSESLAHTNIGLLRQGSLVNLERALAVGQRFGGHMVSGHVDCVAVVQSITPVGQSRCIRLTFSSKYSSEIISKGSVTLDGISLTVNACGEDFLEVNVIPETWSVTTVGQWAVGSKVNLETDIIGKYVRHMLTPFMEKLGVQPQKSAITENLLKQHGFL